jgi:hypothetical protein
LPELGRGCRSAIEAGIAHGGKIALDRPAGESHFWRTDNPMGNLKKKRRLKMNKHKRRKRLKSNRHKKRTWQK